MDVHLEGCEYLGPNQKVAASTIYRHDYGRNAPAEPRVPPTLGTIWPKVKVQISE